MKSMNQIQLAHQTKKEQLLKMNPIKIKIKKSSIVNLERIYLHKNKDYQNF